MTELKEIHTRAKQLIPEEEWEGAISEYKGRIQDFIKDTEITPTEAYQGIRASITNECRIEIMLIAAAAYEIKQENA